MPSVHRSMTLDDVRRFVEEQCFSTDSRNVGAEVEWITAPLADPRSATVFPALQEAVGALGALPGESRITFEPGGQIELSSVASPSATEACDRIAGDAMLVEAALARAGSGMAGIGLDPARGDRRVLHQPRYAAMEAYFDADGPAGRRMMCRTASVQVNLDSGTGRRAASRWMRAHAIGPVLAAAFANSPVVDGRVGEWRSARLATWWSMDRTRTAPARSGDPLDAWASYILGARVMFIRTSEDWYEPVTEPLSFRRWLEHGFGGTYPTLEDLAYHLTTLFPPVRARGWLELRMIDALPDPWWRVAVAVSAALLDDETASAVAAEACAATGSMWVAASRYGLEHPALAAAAHTCFEAAIEALPRTAGDPTTIAATKAFAERYAFRGRSPADDVIQAWTSTGRIVSAAGTTMEPV